MKFKCILILLLVVLLTSCSFRYSDYEPVYEENGVRIIFKEPTVVDDFEVLIYEDENQEYYLNTSVYDRILVLSDSNEMKLIEALEEEVIIINEIISIRFGDYVIDISQKSSEEQWALKDNLEFPKFSSTFWTKNFNNILRVSIVLNSMCMNTVVNIKISMVSILQIFRKIM